MALNVPALVKSAQYAKVFLETGSYKGDGISGGLNVGFERILSVELFDEYYEKCRERFGGFIDSGRVVLFHGDSADLMPDMLRAAGDDRISMFLDAHHYIEESGVGKKWCPLIEEIEAVRATGRQDHIIMVDDISCAQRGEFEFPPEQEIIDALMRVNPKYRLTYEDCIRSKDVLIAWPEDVV